MKEKVVVPFIEKTWFWWWTWATMVILRWFHLFCLETAELTSNGFRDVGHGPGSTAREYIEPLTFHDQAQAVVEDVKPIRTRPLVPKYIPATGSFTTCIPES
jgi:hypothetical protein